MLFKLTGTCDLSKDDIKKLKANGFEIEYMQIDVKRTDLYNTSFRISMYYNLFIKIHKLEDLMVINELLGYELIIFKTTNPIECYSLEVYNGHRE